MNGFFLFLSPFFSGIISEELRLELVASFGMLDYDPN